MKNLCLLFVILAACGDVDAEKPTEPNGWLVGTEKTPDDTVPKHVDDPITPTLVDPTSNVGQLVVPAQDCSYPSIAQASLPSSAQGPEPTVVEPFGQDGCPQEVWVHSFNDGLVSARAYMPWNPPPAYIIPTPWVETYERQGLQEVVERRTAFGGDLFMRTVTTKDAQGRTLRLERLGEEYMFQPNPTWGWVESYNPMSLVLVLQEGTNDGEVTWRRRVETNAQGQPLRAFLLNGPDQIERLVETWTYDQGRLATHDVTEPGNASRSTYSWRADGSYRVTTKTPELGWTDVYDYDAMGRLVLQTQDEDSNGTIEYRLTRAYDADGNEILNRTEYEFVQGVAQSGNETVSVYESGRIMERTETSLGRQFMNESRTVWTYSDDGFETNRYVSYRDGGVMLERTVQDADGNQTLWTQDVGADGTIEWSTTRAFSSVGLLWERVTNENYTQFRELTYDVQGRVVLDATDLDTDGRADFGTRYRYDVDAIEAYNALPVPQPRF
ncbi:MAG: hypothetical protein R3E66_07270 [bacterium]